MSAIKNAWLKLWETATMAAFPEIDATIIA